MKKFIYLSFLAFAFATASNAQLFVGGSLGFDRSSGKIESGGVSVDATKITDLSFTPMVGFFLSEKLAIGGRVGFITHTERTPAAATTSGVEEILAEVTLGIAPFARYYAVKFNKVSLFVEAELGLASKASTFDAGGTKTDGPKTTTIGLNVGPGLSYALTEKIELEAFINGLDFGINHSTKKDETTGTEVVTKATDIGFGVDLDNICTTGFLTIGAIIKF